jgi:Leucine-rich repeat (LRR) protein
MKPSQNQNPTNKQEPSSNILCHFINEGKTMDMMDMEQTNRTQEETRYDDLILEVEELTGDDEAAVHDQLPSVEEAKANLPQQSSGKLKKRLFISFGVVLVVAAIIGGIVAETRSYKAPEPVILTGRGEEIVRFLFEEQVTPLPALKDPTFPQHHAAMFVADGDAYHMDHTESPEMARRFLERYVLAVLYYHFNGPKWNYGLDFLSAQDHCAWYQRFDTSSGKTIRLGVTCDEAGYVTKVNLSQNNLQGRSIPDEIKVLEHVETFHIYFNTISGEIPEGFRHMKKLKSIGLMQTGLTGTIPSWIGEMGQLTTLALGNNNFHGEVPQSISGLTQMRILGLDDNGALSGNIKLFKRMYNLEALYLENNAFTGELPADKKTWPNLVELDASNNMIDNTVPAAIINHGKLAVLDMHKNLMSGVFPDDIFENTNLRVLALHENALEGTIPDRLPFLKNLQHLDFSRNKLTGTIPDDVSELTNLRYWATSNNAFSEQRVPNLSGMTNLVDFSMKYNNLIGTIPDWVGGLNHLEMLDLDNNRLTGSIPTWLGLLRGLNHLLLNRNNLEGSIPAQLQNLVHLDVLLLDGNNISGNADVICEADHTPPSIFTSNCYPGQNGERPQVECRCCTTCCLAGDNSCNNKAWTANVDPTWKYGFLRPNYRFSLANAPAEYSKEEDSSEEYDPIDDAFKA